MLTSCVFRMTIVAGMTFVSAGLSAADTPTQWDFNAPGLAASFGPGNLTFWDDPNDPDAIPGQTQTDTQFGTTTSFGINAIGGAEAGVVRIPAYLGWQGLLCDHRTPGNAGSIYVNQFTLVYDVYITNADYFGGSGWWPFQNANCCNTNDADAYIQAGGGIGIHGTYAGTVNPDTWYRLAFVYDLARTDGTNHWKYIDGALVGTQNLDDGLAFDGQFSLYSTSDGDPFDTFHLFTEPEGLYTGVIYVNSLYYADRTLSEAEIVAFGAADADGISDGSVPCPGDVDGDGDVDLQDLATLLAHFGMTSGATLEDGDLDGDGDVELQDLAILLANFGSTC